MGIIGAATPAAALLVWLASWVVVVVNGNENGVIIIKSSKTRLPLGFLSVLGELEKAAAAAAAAEAAAEAEAEAAAGSSSQEEEVEEEGQEGREETASASGAVSGCTTSAACLLTSRTLTRKERHTVRQVLLGLSDTEALTSKSGGAEGDDDDGNDGLILSVTDSAKAAGCYFDANHQVVCLAMPETLSEVAASVVATGGNLVYIPSAMDLARGEGLLEQLGPALQLILATATASSSAKLTVIVLDPTQIQTAQQHFIQAVEPLLQHLISNKPLATLSDIFQQGVEFTTLEQASARVWADARTTTTGSTIVRDAHVLARLADGIAPIASRSPADDMASRLLVPQAQRIVRQCVQTVTQALQDGKFIPNFRELCSAEIQSAMAQCQQACLRPVAKSPVAQQIKDQMLDTLAAELQALAWNQMGLLFGTALRELRIQLAKVERIMGPKLPQEMHSVVRASVRDFTKRAQQITSDSTVSRPAISEFRRTCQEMVSDRLLELRATNKFKPLPRKGVTIGMHWLLPKPFGNDYRQEPWDVHATDNMVYIPPTSKLSDVNTQTIPTGDWRNQVVPSPVGNDFIYTQN